MIKKHYFPEYVKLQRVTLSKHFEKLQKFELSRQMFQGTFSESAIASSNIEGNPLDYDTYLRWKQFSGKEVSRSVKQIDDLIEAYEYARSKKITRANILHAHKLLSRSFEIDEKHKGAFRNVNVEIRRGMQILYVAAPGSIVKSELNLFFSELSSLMGEKLTIDEVFYYASFIHLVFAHIHPFADGNGRMSRLLEKWFISHHLGDRAWFIKSELLYWKRLKSYYKRINLGKDYDSNDYDRCLPFLLMLPMALRLR